MRSARSYLPLLVFFLLVNLVSCGRKPRLIPEARMSEIYADMFMADQWIRENRQAKRIADTTLFYEPLFKKYGYSFEDFDYSVNYYLDHSDKFLKLLSATTSFLEGKQKETQALSDEEDRIRAFNSMFRGYDSVDFRQDSLRWRDSVVLWPKAGPRSVELPADSLRAEMDSTVIVRQEEKQVDTMSATIENVERRNSIRPHQEQEIRKLPGD